MMRYLILLIYGLLSACAANTAPGRAVGVWHGDITIGNGQLTVIVHIAEDETKVLTGFIEAPQQEPGRQVEMSALTVTDEHLHFSIASQQASYDGDWNDERQMWKGVWTQSGIGFTLNLERGKPPPPEPVEGMDGVWEGAVTRNGKSTRLVIKIETNEHGTKTVFDSPDYALTDILVQGLIREGNDVRFTIPATGAEFSGRLSGDGGSMAGIWKFGGRPDSEVAFVRTGMSVSEPARNRPQLPKEPFAYRAIDVSYDNLQTENVKLSGTLTLPEGLGPFPAAILLSGSGPQDRDQTIFGHKTFAVLADYLTKKGIAVLRYDDRGVGQSTGAFATATSADFATDANAAARYLLTRPDIDPHAIGFIGHSEGGVAGPLAAIANEDIGFLIMLAGPGVNLTEISIAQYRMFATMSGAPEEEIAKSEPVLREIFTVIAATKTQEDAQEKIRPLLTPSALRALGASEDQEDMIIHRLTSDWQRFILQYDPEATLSQLKIPVLALNGSLDQQVIAVPNLEAIKRALAHNPDAKVLQLDGLNHMFQSAETGVMGEYIEIEETFAPVALEVISNWLDDRF